MSQSSLGKVHVRVNSRRVLCPAQWDIDLMA